MKRKDKRYGMKMKGISIRSILYLVFSFFIALSFAIPPQDNNQRRASTQSQSNQTPLPSEGDEPDSLLRARWRIQKTAPMEVADLDSSALDLKRPDNIRQTVEYDDSANVYYVGSKIGDSYLNAPVLMTPEEYTKWSEKRALHEFFRKKDAENVQTQGKDKFSFADMHFDLGPAEKIFGPGGVRIKTQGTAELKIGANLKSIDNPSLPIRNRKTTAFDFDEKINLSVNGKVGDKVNMNLNYNTDATFDFDAQNLKLKYEGKEDEIIKLVEAGNVSFPTNNSLVKGASSLFGLRTDMQFGKLKLQTVLSQKKSSSKSVSSKGGTQTTAFEMDVADYEENRHFFLSQYFREHYDEAMSKLPNLATGIDRLRRPWRGEDIGKPFLEYGRPDHSEQCRQFGIQFADHYVCRRPRHRRCEYGADGHPGFRERLGLRETGECPTAQLFGIYGQQVVGLYLAEDRSADRPGAGCGLRIYAGRRELSGG